MKNNKIQKGTLISGTRNGEDFITDVDNVTDEYFEFSIMFTSYKFDYAWNNIDREDTSVTITATGTDVRYKLKRNQCGKIAQYSSFIDRFLDFSAQMNRSLEAKGVVIDEVHKTHLSTYSTIGAHLSVESGMSESHCGTSLEITVNEKEIIMNILYYYSELKNIFENEYKDLSNFFKGKTKPENKIYFNAELYDAILKKERDEAKKVSEELTKENKRIIDTLRSAKTSISFVQNLFDKNLSK